MDDKQYIEFLKRHIGSLTEIIRSYEAMFNSKDKKVAKMEKRFEKIEETLKVK